MYSIQRVLSEADRAGHGEVRHAVYVEEKQWLPVEPASGGRESDEFDSQSRLLLARHYSTGEPVGSMRVILSGGSAAPLPLPVQSPPFCIPIDEHRTAAEVSRLAVKRDFRGDHLVLLGLCRLALQELIEMGVDDCFVIVEKSLFRRLRWIGFPFRQLASPTHHLGGPVMPAVVPVDAVVPGVVAMGRFARLFEEQFDGVIGAELLTA